jgi:hypothetical protein
MAATTANALSTPLTAIPVAAGLFAGAGGGGGGAAIAGFAAVAGPATREAVEPGGGGAGGFGAPVAVGGGGGIAAGLEGGGIAPGVAAAVGVPPVGNIGNLTVGEAVGLGGKLMRTVSFFGCTFAASDGLGGIAPPGTLGMFSDIMSYGFEN